MSFQQNAFQSNAFQVGGVTDVILPLGGRGRKRKKPLYNVYFNELPIGVESAKELIELARISDSIPRVTLSKREDYGSKITALKKAIKQIEAERNMQIEQQEEEEATLFLMFH